MYSYYNNMNYNWQYPNYGYNPYYTMPTCNYNFPTFTPILNFNIPATTPNFISQPYSVSSSAESSPSFKENSNLLTQTTIQPKATENKKTEDKGGMPSWAKWALGAVAVAGVCTLAYFCLKDKNITKTADDVAKKIDFKPASTLDDAKAFASNNFGVQYCDIDDLQAVNYCNEWLTRTHNSCKTITNSSYPKIITNHDAGLASMFNEPCVINGVKYEVLGINMKTFSNPIDKIDELISSGDVIKKASDGKYLIVNDKYKTDFVDDFVRKLNLFDSTNATFAEKVDLWNNFRSIQQGQFVNGKLVPVNFGKYHILDHELGHLRHRYNSIDFEAMLKSAEYLKRGKNISNISKEFLENKEIQETARKVSMYATESPAEFVAETFGLLNSGRSLPEDVMALYKKYGGPALS